VETSTKARLVVARARRLVLLCGLAPLVLTAGLALSRPAFLTRLDNTVYDILVRRVGTKRPAGRVVIVDVDERSLSELGQWPWRRDLIGELVARLRDLGASVVALDVVFAEPDRYERSTASGEVRSNAGVPSGPDKAFADALGGGRVVLGYALTFDASATASSGCVLHPVGLALVEAREESGSPFFRASGAICNLPSLARAAGASGFLNAAPDADGILRRVPLLIELDGRVYPALALAAVTAASGVREFALKVANVNAASLTVGDRTVPLDGKSNLLVRYRGPKRTFPYISVADVLGRRVAPDALRDKIVFVGATALGTREVVATPLDTLFAGVEVQATVADNLLSQDFIERPENARVIEMGAVILVGLMVVLLGRAGPAWGGAAAAAGLLVVWIGAVGLLSTRGWFLSPLFPTAGAVSALAAMTLTKVSVERRRADRSAAETVMSQRLMVQSLLSLTAVRDAETGRHSRRTQRYARLLGDQLASHPRFRDYLTPDRVELLSSLAPLHDIGKVGVPDRVLNKPGALTPDELAEIRKHPTHGFEVILQAERRAGSHDDAILAMAKEIVYTHHEKWDGTGYPHGLAAEQIPIPGRVMALVDVYDALITRCVYRPPMTHSQAVEFIVSGKGTHFDPAVVEAFVVVAPVFRSVSTEADS